MSSVELSNFKWYGTKEELCKLMESMNGKLVDEIEWTIVNNAELEIYNAQKFLLKGYEYIQKKPVDMIQSAQKFWLAAAWTLKHFYLNLGLNITSHYAMDFFVDFALDCNGSLPQKDVRATYSGWKTAEKFHRVEYGKKVYALREFLDKIPDVECFVNKFPKLNVDVIRPQLLNFLEKECETSSKNKILIKKKLESVLFGNEYFDCLYIAC